MPPPLLAKSLSRRSRRRRHADAQIHRSRQIQRGRDLGKRFRRGTLEAEDSSSRDRSAFKNKGVQTLLDAVVDYLPSPLDVPPMEGVNPKTGQTETRPPDASAPFPASYSRSWRIASWSIVVVRIYSGSIKAGSYAYNPVKEYKRSALVA